MASMNTEDMSPREARGLQIASLFGERIKQTGRGLWSVPSQSSPGVVYRVDMRQDKGHCNCPDWNIRHLPCKHCVAVIFVILRQPLPSPAEAAAILRTRPSYPPPAGWRPYNQSQVAEPLLFERLAVKLCHATVVQPPYVFGRPHAPLANIVLFGVMRGWIGDDARATQGWLERLGTVEDIPAYNTFLKYFARESMTPILRAVLARSAQPFRGVDRVFAVDSTGFAASGMHRWFNLKHRTPEHARAWAKAHIMCGCRSHAITAMEVGAENSADSPQFEPLVRATAAAGFDGAIERVCADKAYLAVDAFRLLREMGGEAVIAFKENSVEGEDPDWRRAFHEFSAAREGYLDKYHDRSNVETTNSSIKRTFSEDLLSKTFVGMRNELYARAIAYNVGCVVRTMFELGIERKFMDALPASESLPTLAGPSGLAGGGSGRPN